MSTPASVSFLGTPVPYLTVDELKRSPVSLSLKNLVPGGAQTDQDAELGRIILRASAMINAECNQNLAATVDTEVGQVYVNDYGDLRIHTRSNPIIQVISVSVGADPYSLTAVSDLTKVVLDPWRITIPRGTNPFFNIGPQLSLIPGRRLWAEWTYCNGYPVTTLTSAVSAGATSMTVANATGILAGTPLTIEDGKFLEIVTPTAVNGNTLTVPALSYAHQAGVGVSGLPDDIKEAALLLISRMRDSYSVAMGAISGTEGMGQRPPKQQNVLADVASMLDPYRRVW